MHHTMRAPTCGSEGGGVTCMKEIVQHNVYSDEPLLALCYDCVGPLEVPSRGPIQGSGLQNDGK